MNNKNLSKSGAALLITMLLIASVGALALAVSRITLSELRITTTFADSVVAYQSAESGVEDALLRFRYDRSLVLDDEDMGNGAKVYMTHLANKFERTSSNPLKKDEIVELDVSNNPFLITATWDALEGDSGWFEWRVSGTSGESKWHTIPDVKDIQALPGFSEVISAGVSDPQTLVIKFLSNTPGAKASVLLQPNTGSEIDTGITTVESVGTSNNTQRKLVVTVNRKSGQIIDIFDYTIYAGEGSIQP